MSAKSKRRLTFECDHELADALEAIAAEESGLEGSVSISRVLRAACVEFARNRGVDITSKSGCKNTLQPLTRKGVIA